MEFIPNFDTQRKIVENKIRQGILKEEDGVVFNYTPYTLEEFIFKEKTVVGYVSLGSLIKEFTPVCIAEIDQTNFRKGDLVCRDRNLHGSFMKVKDFISKRLPQKLTVSYQGKQIFQIGE